MPGILLRKRTGPVCHPLKGFKKRRIMEIKYMSCAETAKFVRTESKKNFPGVKFSVRSSVYSGGASIGVSRVLGPTTKEVDAIAG